MHLPLGRAVGPRRVLCAVATCALAVVACGSSAAPGTDGTSSETGGSPGTGGSAGNDAGAAGKGASGGNAGVLGSGGSAGSGGVISGGSGGGANVGGGGGDAVASNIAGGVRWVGRVDTSDPNAVRAAWTGPGFVATVSGTTISVKLKSEGGRNPFFQAVIDGAVGKRFSIPSGTEQTVDLATGLGASDHVVELYRESEAFGNPTTTFEGFTQGTVKAPPAYSGRLIEFVGDSITCGYGNLGKEDHPNYGTVNGCTYSTDTQSGYQTFGAMAARALNADASILANSGWGLIRGAGALPSVYANTLGTSASPAWDFAQKPQAVVINLGSNDYRSGDPGQAFVDAYVQFTSAIRAKYPKAWILLGTGDVQNGADLDSLKVHVKAVIDARAAQGDDRMSELDFGTQNALLGTGCDWHPNVAEHKRMADLLVAELKVKLGW